MREVIWTAQGDVRWEPWWVERYGHTRSRIPDLEDHLSFVNFDLSRNGYRTVTRDERGRLVINERPSLHQLGVPSIELILEKHGFRLGEHVTD